MKRVEAQINALWNWLGYAPVEELAARAYEAYCREHAGVGFLGSEKWDKDADDTQKSFWRAKQTPRLTLDLVAEGEAKLDDQQYLKFHRRINELRNSKCQPVCRCLSATKEERLQAVIYAANLGVVE